MRVALLGFVVCAAAGAQSAKPDALKLLDEVTQRYAQAESYRIDAVQVDRHGSELMTSEQTMFLRAEEGPGNHYRFEGRSFSGEGIVVADGTTEWELRESFGDYTVRPAGSYGHPFPKTVQDADSNRARDAFHLRGNLAAVATNAKSASLLPDETIVIGDRGVHCKVVTLTEEDLRAHAAGTHFRYTYWIETARSVIVKTRYESDYIQPYDPNRKPIKPIANHTESVTTYTVVSLNEPLPQGDFVLELPAGATKVAELPAPWGVTQGKRPDMNPDVVREMVGKMAPGMTYVAADGSTLKLDSLRGHPVVLDLWATWCGPCVQEMPMLERIYRRTKDLGLVMVGLDEDKDLTTAPDYLRRKGYAWADYHIDVTKGYGLPNTGIPLLVLIDPTGKIVYYHDGGDDVRGLETAIRALGAEYAAALDKPK